MAKNFKDYPAPFPAGLKKLGFKDLSWHNDAAGRATLQLRPGKLAGKLAIVVWCAEKKKSEREFPNETRFNGYICSGDADGELHDKKYVFHAESETDLLRKVRALIKRRF